MFKVLLMTFQTLISPPMDSKGRYVVIREGTAEFYLDGIKMGSLLTANYYEEVLMYIIDKWNNEEVLLHTYEWSV